MSKKDIEPTDESGEDVSEKVETVVTNETLESKRISVLPLRDVVVYPHMVIPLFVGREKSIVIVGRTTDNNDRTADTKSRIRMTKFC